MRTQLEIFLGFLLTVIVAVVVLYSGFTEESRMLTVAEQSKARSIEIGADLYAQACASCHGSKGEGVPGLCPPLNSKALFTSRMQEVGWTGSLRDYIISTVSAGRLASTRPDQYVGNGRPAMPSWSEEYGGPFRGDQIDNLADFILNWETEALAQPDVTPVPVDGVGTDIMVELPAGDATRGEITSTSAGCTGCHIATATGPAWLASGSEPGIGARAETRFTEADYAGTATSAQQYLLEAIVLPNAHVVSGFAAGVMPQTYGATLTAEQVADIIAYMLSLK